MLGCQSVDEPCPEFGDALAPANGGRVANSRRSDTVRRRSDAEVPQACKGLVDVADALEVGLEVTLGDRHRADRNQLHALVP